MKYEALLLQVTFRGLKPHSAGPQAESWHLSALWGSGGLCRTEGSFYSQPSKGLVATSTTCAIKKLCGGWEPG